MSELSDAWQKRINWLRERMRENGGKIEKPTATTNVAFYRFINNRGNHNLEKYTDEKLKEEQQQTLAILKREFPDRIDEIDKIRWFAFGLEEVMLRHCDWLVAKRH